MHECRDRDGVLAVARLLQGTAQGSFIDGWRVAFVALQFFVECIEAPLPDGIEGSGLGDLKMQQLFGGLARAVVAGSQQAHIPAVGCRAFAVVVAHDLRQGCCELHRQCRHFPVIKCVRSGGGVIVGEAAAGVAIVVVAGVVVADVVAVCVQVAVFDATVAACRIDVFCRGLGAAVALACLRPVGAAFSADILSRGRALWSVV